MTADLQQKKKLRKKNDNVKEMTRKISQCKKARGRSSPLFAFLITFQIMSFHSRYFAREHPVFIKYVKENY